MFLLYSPLNQGLKHEGMSDADVCNEVFTLQSIKSRIETLKSSTLLIRYFRFLLYSPLNQGLKPEFPFHPEELKIMFLLYSPLNQGLKLRIRQHQCARARVFTLQSIKSRIETRGY